MARVENELKIYSPDEEESGVNTLRGATDEARDFEKKMASGGLSLAQQQLRQGLSSAAQQQAAMGAGGGLSARAGMLAGAQQASQGVGQSAALRAQEEAGARQQTMGALTNQAAGQSTLAGQKLQASQAQADHHAAIMAENRAQEEADRAFGMEIAGALVSAASGAAALSSMDLKDRRSADERSSLMTSPAGAKNPDGTLVDPNDPVGALARPVGHFTSRERPDPAAQGMGSKYVIGGRPTAKAGRHMFYHDTTPIERGPGAAPDKPAEVYDNPDLSPPEENPSAHLSPSGAATPGVAREDIGRRPEYPDTRGTSDQNVYLGRAGRGLGEDRVISLAGEVRDAGYMPSQVENRQSKSLAETMGEKAYEKGFADYRKGLADDKKRKDREDREKRSGESKYARKKEDKGTRSYSNDLGGKIERGFQKYKDARDERDYKSKLREKTPQWGGARQNLAKHKAASATGKMPKSGPEGALRGAAKKGGTKGMMDAILGSKNAGAVAAGGTGSEMRGKDPMPPNYLAGWKPMYPGEQPGDHLRSLTSSHRNPRYGTDDVVETMADGTRVNRSLEAEKRARMDDFLRKIEEDGVNSRRADEETAMRIGRRVRERMQTAPERERGFRRTDSRAVNETLDGLQTYPYTYKPPKDRPKEGRGLDLDEGPRRGPMAEELERTPLGKEAVIDTPTGDKIHHDNYLYGVVTPGLKEVHEREKETRSKVDALAAQLDRLGKETERRMAGGKKRRAPRGMPTPPERRYEDGPTFDDVRHHMDIVEESPPLPSYQDPNEDLGGALDDKTRAAVDRYRNFYDHLSSTVPTSRHPGNPRGFSFSHGEQREREDRHGRRR